MDFLKADVAILTKARSYLCERNLSRCTGGSQNINEQMFFYYLMLKSKWGCLWKTLKKSSARRYWGGVSVCDLRQIRLPYSCTFHRLCLHGWTYLVFSTSSFVISFTTCPNQRTIIFWSHIRHQSGNGGREKDELIPPINPASFLLFLFCFDIRWSNKPAADRTDPKRLGQRDTISSALAQRAAIRLNRREGFVPQCDSPLK